MMAKTRTLRAALADGAATVQQTVGKAFINPVIREGKAQACVIAWLHQSRSAAVVRRLTIYEMPNQSCTVNKWRIVSAFLVAPIVVPVVFSAPVLIHFRVLDFLAGLLILSIYALPVAYIFELLIGLPAWFLFRIFRLKSLVAFAVGGAVIGLLVDVILKTASRSLCDWSLGDTLYVLAALGSALLFRVIAFFAPTAQSA